VDPKQSHDGASHATQLIEVSAATSAVPARSGRESRSKPSALRQNRAGGELDVLEPELVCG
jgi:hypothetical protein